MSDLTAETAQLNDDFDDEEGFNPDEPNEELCHTCGGDGWGIVGVDWESDDPINGPYDGEIEKCPNCGGSGLAKDCWYW
jgi:hypothetical protein